jgi:hypothetical protein
MRPKKSISHDVNARPAWKLVICSPLTGLGARLALTPAPTVG